MYLKSPLTALKGVGERRMSKYMRLGIRTIEDLITHYPRSYHDKSVEVYLNESNGEVPMTFRLCIRTKQSFFKNGKQNLRMTAADGLGHVCNIFYFNATYLMDKFEIGETYLFFSTVQKTGSNWQMAQPDHTSVEKSGDFKRIEPVYPLTAGVTSRELANLVDQALSHVKIHENLPGVVIEEHGLMGRKDALDGIHFPKILAELPSYRRRLVFEELFTFQLGLLLLKGRYTQREGIRFGRRKEEVEALIASLPFELTEGQKTAWSEIEGDMATTNRMNRLLQGDVGSGKTILAVLAAHMAILNGYQVILMAPTEILANQHLDSLRDVFSKAGSPHTVELLTSSSKNKVDLKRRIATGEVDVIIGTHALLTEDVGFHRLGLVITDEQHRFGVRQRHVIAAKGEAPDVLVMSATPIPRTLSLILYGDMDVSLVKELPKSRKPIGTHHVKPHKEDDLYGFMEKAFEEGRQAYAVCPLIEESEELDLTSAVAYHERLSKRFKKYRVELLHGKMKAADKQRTMEAFAAGEIQLLVSTTVIEVGVNVPNATIMVITNSERFGLSQLHQLRGRVGRGHEKSWCFLMANNPGKIAMQRIEMMVRSQSGFEIAEKDLELRGPGELLGNRQHGVPDFKLANLVTDMETLKEAQLAAKAFVSEAKEFSLDERSLMEASERIFEGFSL